MIPGLMFIESRLDRGNQNGNLVGLGTIDAFRISFKYTPHPFGDGIAMRKGQVTVLCVGSAVLIPGLECKLDCL